MRGECTGSAWGERTEQQIGMMDGWRRKKRREGWKEERCENKALMFAEACFSGP